MSPQEQIAQAKEWDLLTYLQRYDPHQPRPCGRKHLLHREHDSLKISNGKWNWFSRKIGGKTAWTISLRSRAFLYSGGGSPGGAEPLSPASGGQAGLKEQGPGSWSSPKPAGALPILSAIFMGGASTTM